MSPRRKLLVRIDKPRPWDDPDWDEPYNPEKCPVCRAVDSIEVGFGLAGGGYGAYEYCNSCKNILGKVQEAMPDD